MTPVEQGVDNAIRAAWKDMQGFRRERDRLPLSLHSECYYGRQAREYKHLLTWLLQIRKGEWA